MTPQDVHVALFHFFPGKYQRHVQKGAAILQFIHISPGCQE